MLWMDTEQAMAIRTKSNPNVIPKAQERDGISGSSSFKEHLSGVGHPLGIMIRKFPLSAACSSDTDGFEQ
jgi:hypothetical protein